MLRFRDLGASFSSLGCFVFEIWVVRAFSSFSSASFSKLPSQATHFRTSGLISHVFPDKETWMIIQTIYHSF